MSYTECPVKNEKCIGKIERAVDTIGPVETMGNDAIDAEVLLKSILLSKKYGER